MNRWRKFWSLPGRERWRLAGYAACLPLVIAGLRLLGFRRVQSLLARTSKGAGTVQPVEPALAEARRTAALVEAAARHGLVKATCLPRALLTWWLLRRRGIPAELRIGVQKRGEQVQAHAWVRWGEVVISEGEAVERNFRAFEGILLE